MYRRSFRHGLVIALLVTAAGAALFASMVDRQLRTLAASEHAADARFDALVQTIARFDTTQQTFDPNRESEAEWFADLHRLLAQIQSDGAGLHQIAAADTAAAARTFTAAAERVSSAVARAEENLRAGHELMATDLVQDEGRPGADAMRAAVLEWRAAEATAAGTARTTQLQQLWLALGAAAAFGVLGVLLLARLPGTGAAPLEAAPAVSAPPSLASEPARELPATNDVAVGPSLPPAFDLSPLSALCADIARADSQASLDALLGRTAAALDAAGIVVWLKETAQELTPAAVHGYGPRARTLLQALPLDQANATTAAWHTGAEQVVAGTDDRPGALAVPMFQGARCTGVFTAELRGGGEHDSARRAIAGILAAQLAAVLSPSAALPAATEPPLEATGS
jgi:hypothetical protein